MNCNARGGMGLAKSMTSIDASRVGSHMRAGMLSTIRNAIPKIAIVSHPKRAPDVGFHKHNGLKASSPLCMVSNTVTSTAFFSGLSPGDVRSVSFLGSTTSSTVCNSHTTCNMILIAAGRKGDSGVGISCDNCMNLDGPACGPRCIGSARCTRLCGRTLCGCGPGNKGCRNCARRRVNCFESNSGPSLCPGAS